MSKLAKFPTKHSLDASEAEVESSAVERLKGMGYEVKLRKSGNKNFDAHWPSKETAEKGKNLTGKPDIFVFHKSPKRLICVWENKSPKESAKIALNEAQYYIEGLHGAFKQEKPGLPRIAAGYNGKDLYLSYLSSVQRKSKKNKSSNSSQGDQINGQWVSLKYEGVDIQGVFPSPDLIGNGITYQGVIRKEVTATVESLRAILPRLKTLYRVIPILSSGRTPIDFTIAMLTLKLLIEQRPDWGRWADQLFQSDGSSSPENALLERFLTLSNRIMSDNQLRERYGDIFSFKEKSDTSEVAFSFDEVVKSIPTNKEHFQKLFGILDDLPSLLNAEFDIFGEVYQFIGDEATKKALGEFFTGRHIIAALIPVFMSRSGIAKSYETVSRLKIADIACGTGGFLTETLRYLKKELNLEDKTTRNFAKRAFFGYDIGHANASRARVNMYFAGDGFSCIEGSVDTLSDQNLPNKPSQGFSAILTNPPYGKSSYGRSEEAFLERSIELLKAGSGWGLIVLPTGVLENPRSRWSRFNLLKNAAVTDVIVLPKHAFAPYTQQRTAVLIFNKRKKPIAVKEKDWDSLVEHVGHEQVNMFIVDNDGFANSDKRYPTDRKNRNGTWLHNDLADWVDKSGRIHKGKLYEAMIKKKAPAKCRDEFGVGLGKKYGTIKLKKLVVEERGVNLLPDYVLRHAVTHMTHDEFVRRADKLLEFRLNPDVEIGSSFQEELNILLTTPVSYDVNPDGETAISDWFDIERGDQGLTEAQIYKYYEKNGIPVYGGGASPPRFFVSEDMKTSGGKNITVFSGPAIVVSMDGTAGAMRVIDDGRFALNHHGRILKPKQDHSLSKEDLYWCVQQVEPGLRRLASNKKGSATLTAPHLQGYKFFTPANGEPDKEVGIRRKCLLALRDEFLGGDNNGFKD